MSFANLPPAIATSLRALQAADGPGVLANFTEAAVLVDQGREYRGDAIKQWYGRVFRSASATAHPISLARHGHETTLTVMVKGNDQAGGARPAELDWLFTIEGGKISGLTITRARSVDLPAPIAAYVLATNTIDLEALMATFADDALVNDQLCEYWGKAAIREWAERDIIRQRVTMYVVKAVEHYGHAVVTANVDGDYDKRGLPDPLVLAFYFSAYRDKIVQLIILRNEPQVE
jgi:ketosteroid isomerase-like protein